MLMRLVNASNLIGCGGDFKQSEPIRNKVGAWRCMEGHRGGMEGCGGAQRGAEEMEGCRMGAEGHRGVYGGGVGGMEGLSWGHEGVQRGCGGLHGLIVL